MYTVAAAEIQKQGGLKAEHVREIGKELTQSKRRRLHEHPVAGGGGGNQLAATAWASNFCLNQQS
jgi:hypothetical protein